MRKGITESHMQMIVWIILGLAIVMLLIWVALFYFGLLPFKVVFE